MVEQVDCVVIGAGVVGLAIAASLADRGREVLVLESEPSIGSGTSSRNSEVVHAGIYYRPGSLKARLCREGKQALYDFCAARNVSHDRLGKLIVAADETQLPRLRQIAANAQQNQVEDLEWLDRETVSRLEPGIVAHCALRSPSTGIVDSHGLMLALEGELSTLGGMVVLRAPVTAGNGTGTAIELSVGGDEPMTIAARSVVNAAGLGAQAVARSIAGLHSGSIPPRHLAIGQYFRLTGRAPFRHLVYPVPVAGGLGIHLTLDLGGQAKFGPDVRWLDTIDYGFDETRLPAFVDAIRHYYPAIDATRLHPDYTGIRPKIVPQGAPDADFRIDDASVHGVSGLVNLFGIESPGLTASLAIGRHVADLLSPRSRA
ncbi:MAG: NAD(P)/FAD-dependent oxidoreductase [Sandaracinobacteroides sp.]